MISSCDEPLAPLSCEETVVFSVTAAWAGRRLDQILAERFTDHSRSRLVDWIKGGSVQVDGRPGKPSDRLQSGQRIDVQVPAPSPVIPLQPELIALDIIHEDDDLLVIDKPPGLVVHPGAGNPAGTLQNALLHHAPALVNLPRAGLVHRLDKDTSGLMVVAKTLTSHTRLVSALQAREIRREYDAVVIGALLAGGTVDAPLGRHPRDRLRIAVRDGGRDAVTHYRVSERYAHHTRLALRLETGRTHQIRVHLAHLGHPVLGDPLYAGRLRLPAGIDPVLADVLRGFKRQALHATRLGLVHPGDGFERVWERPPPADMQALITALRLQDGA
jgi:23S rRNA pseudouridine1911/1915/1917 synthase